MITADWVAVGLVLVFALLGVLLGFGKGLKFFTSGIFGIIISIFVCYCVGGLILDLKFVQELLNKFIAAIENKNGFCDFLIKIHIEIIVYYVALFIVVQIVRIIIVAILKGIVESNAILLKIINRTLGLVLFLGVLLIVALFVFQIIGWIGGSTAADFANMLDGSLFKLDKLFLNNPLLSLAERF